MIALYIALLMQMPRPYWAMATVYIVSSPFLGPTSSKALYRAIGTFLGAAAAVLFVPMFVQSPYVLVVVIALWTGILLFLSLHLRTANNYALMLAGYTLPLIALPTVDNPLAVWDVAEARTEEIFSVSPWRQWSARCSGRVAWRRCSTTQWVNGSPTPPPTA